MCKAWDDNMATSREEGRQEGRQEERLSIVTELLMLGQPLTVIKKVSKYTEKKIRELATDIGVSIIEE